MAGAIPGGARLGASDSSVSTDVWNSMNIIKIIDLVRSGWDQPFQERIDNWSDAFKGHSTSFGFFCIIGCSE